jgi:hypothetical protein
LQKIAIDGTKNRAHNSKKANFNQKIDRHLAYIEEKPRILNQLDDCQDSSIRISKIQEKIARLQTNKIEILQEN